MQQNFRRQQHNSQVVTHPSYEMEHTQNCCSDHHWESKERVQYSEGVSTFSRASSAHLAWRQWQYFPQKWHLSTSLQDITSQQAVLFTVCHKTENVKSSLQTCYMKWSQLTVTALYKPWTSSETTPQNESHILCYTTNLTKSLVIKKVPVTSESLRRHTITSTCCSHTIVQKSVYVDGKGACVTMNGGARGVRFFM